MKIEHLRKIKNGDRPRVTATVSWEDCDRPTRDVYFETEEAFTDDLTLNPNAFLLSCAIPAMHYGEKRVFIDAEICPELRDGLQTALSWLSHWFYGSDHRLIQIEANNRLRLPSPRTPERAGFFFSGGIDSFATLRTNRRNYPLDHPWSIKDGLLVYGLELDNTEAFDYVKHSLSHVAEKAYITIIPVYTNIYLNYRQEDALNKWSFWESKYQGAALASIAHIFARRLTVVSIPSSEDIPTHTLINRQHFIPFGSHPLLDPNYSSCDLKIRHDGITLSRLSKTKLTADWDTALQNLRVCNRYKLYRTNRLNCGKCEKCLRTMLALMALGLLDKTEAFKDRDVINNLRSQPYLKPYYYMELLPILKNRGHYDIALIIEQKLNAYHKLQKRNYWTAKIKKIDRHILKGTLLRVKRSIFAKA